MFLLQNTIFFSILNFCKNQNTTMALIGLTDKILSLINNRDYVNGAFLDKAFDKVQNTILVKKYR